MTAVAARTLRIGGNSYPVVLPSIRDPRLHLAGVIITIHVLGQIALGFAVSVPQILSAILACALIELVWTFVESRKIVWPASAMLTGSGVALILRIVGQSPDDHWTWDRWYLFASVAAASLLTKYLIRYRGTHVFNPSNVGLVASVPAPGKHASSNHSTSGGVPPSPGLLRRLYGDPRRGHRHHGPAPAALDGGDVLGDAGGGTWVCWPQPVTA